MDDLFLKERGWGRWAKVFEQERLVKRKNKTGNSKIHKKKFQ